MATKSAEHQAKPVAAELRTERGTKLARITRATGRLPAVIYGLKQEVVAVTLPAAETVSVLQSGSHILEVTVGGKTEKMLIQDVQYDHLQLHAIHLDLLRIDPTKKVRVKVALEFRGTPKGTKEGGILERQTTELEIEVSPLAIPDNIRVNVENLEMHQILHAKDIVMPEGAKLVDYGEKIICQVRTVKEEVVAVAVEAGPAEPEVIGKKKEEEEGAEGAAEGAAKAAPGKAAAPAAAAPAKK